MQGGQNLRSPHVAGKEIVRILCTEVARPERRAVICPLPTTSDSGDSWWLQVSVLNKKHGQAVVHTIGSWLRRTSRLGRETAGRADAEALAERPGTTRTPPLAVASLDTGHGRTDLEPVASTEEETQNPLNQDVSWPGEPRATKGQPPGGPLEALSARQPNLDSLPSGNARAPTSLGAPRRSGPSAPAPPAHSAYRRLAPIMFTSGFVRVY